MTEEIYRSDWPTTICFGAGARRLLTESLIQCQVRRPLLVTDRAVVKLPLFEDLVSHVKPAAPDVRVFSEIWGNPVKSQVLAGVQCYRETQRDGIVAVGGGAAIDVAKAIALLAHHPGDLFDYEDGKPGARPVDQPMPFVAALPTTAGTGSEVGRSTVVSDDETHAKKIIFSPRLMPQRVFLDPEMTLKLPADVTAATGMDALTHLVESYLAKGFHPMCDGIALEGLRYVAESLKQAVMFAQGGPGSPAEHLHARAMMLNAAMMGGVAFQKGLGITHSCAHALSTVCDLHHGLANGIMIPYAMMFNLPAARARFAVMAQVVEVSGPEGFIEWLRRLKADIGIPRDLKAVGVTPEQIPRLVQVALRDGCHALNVRSADHGDFERLFAEALG